MVEVSFGEWLRRQRRAAGLTQQQLAEQMNCSTITLRKIEAEERNPSAQLVDCLAEIFNIPQDERATFLRFARGDWHFAPTVQIQKAPWRVPSTNLPIPLTSFIGREKEVEEIIQSVSKNRLVTLIGAGGVGKTRLAIQSSNKMLSNFKDGVWWVELAPLTKVTLLPQVCAKALSVREVPNQSLEETLSKFLYSKHILLVLDNCEHLIVGCARLTDRLLSTCPNLKILTSSREALGIKGELSYPVPSLSLPDIKHLPVIEHLSQYEVVRLFIDRALLVAPHFVVDKDNAPFIAQICYRLDGIPLAIELAAARVKILSAEQISKRLDDRFRLLTGGARTALPRQQTLRALIDWSYDLLIENERLLMRRLSVFAGGWTLEAAEEVCAGDDIEAYDVLDLLTQLVNKSLVVVIEHSQSGETRYSMLETIRQYTREKLLETGEREVIRVKHLAYFVKLAEQAQPELYRSNQVFWLNNLDDELDNLRMALEWALATDIEAGLQIAVFSSQFWQSRGYRQELGDWLWQFLERHDTKDSLHVRGMATYCACLNDFVQARSIAEHSLQLAHALSDKQAEAISLMALGVVISLHGNLKEGIPLVEQSCMLYRTLEDKLGQATAMTWLILNHNDLEQMKTIVLEGLRLFREMGHLSGIAVCLSRLARRTIWGGDFSSPDPWLEEAKTIYRQLGDKAGEADTLNICGSLAYWLGNYQQARIYYEESILLYEKVGADWMSSWSRSNLAYVALRQGDILQAREMFSVCIQRFQKINTVIGLIYAIEGLASLNVNQEHPQRATRLFAWADAEREKIGDHRPPVEAASVERDWGVIHSKLNDTEYASLFAEGRAMTIEQAIQCALEVENESEDFFQG